MLVQLPTASKLARPSFVQESQVNKKGAVHRTLAPPLVSAGRVWAIDTPSFSLDQLISPSYFTRSLTSNTGFSIDCHRPAPPEVEVGVSTATIYLISLITPFVCFCKQNLFVGARERLQLQKRLASMLNTSCSPRLHPISPRLLPAVVPPFLQSRRWSKNLQRPVHRKGVRRRYTFTRCAQRLRWMDLRKIDEMLLS